MIQELREVGVVRPDRGGEEGRPLGLLTVAVRAPRPATSLRNDLEGRCGAAGLTEHVAVGEVVGLSTRGEVLVDGIVQPVGRVRRVAHVDGGDLGEGWVVVQAIWFTCSQSIG